MRRYIRTTIIGMAITALCVSGPIGFAQGNGNGGGGGGGMPPPPPPSDSPHVTLLFGSESEALGISEGGRVTGWVHNGTTRRPFAWWSRSPRAKLRIGTC